MKEALIELTTLSLDTTTRCIFEKLPQKGVSGRGLSTVYHGGMQQALYTIEFGSYYLKQNGRILHMCDQVAIAYKDGVLYRHGDPKSVSDFSRQNKLDTIIFPRGFPTDELNMCLQSSTYLPFLLEKIAQGEFDHIGSPMDLYAAGSCLEVKDPDDLSSKS